MPAEQPPRQLNTVKLGVYSRATPSEAGALARAFLGYQLELPPGETVDPGLNPPRVTHQREQMDEAELINRRVAIRNAETWEPGASEAATKMTRKLRARLECAEREREAVADCQSPLYLPDPQDDQDLRHGDGSSCPPGREHALLPGKREKAGTPVNDPPYPRQGLRRERWCLFCNCLLVESDESGTRLVSCQCANTTRYGPMETAGDEHTARLLSEKFWACQTFAEAQEFLLARLHAHEFTRDIRPHTTLVTGLVVDRWPVHMRAPHKDKMRRLGFPAELLIGEEPIVEFPARIALATADDTVRMQDLKAPVQTDPMRLTGWAHVKAQQTAIDLEGQPDEGLIAAKCKKLTTASTKNSTSCPMMSKYVKYGQRVLGRRRRGSGGPERLYD